MKNLLFNMPGVVACTCNPATLEAEFWNSVDLILVRWVGGLGG